MFLIKKYSEIPLLLCVCGCFCLPTERGHFLFFPPSAVIPYAQLTGLLHIVHDRGVSFLI